MSFSKSFEVLSTLNEKMREAVVLLRRIKVIECKKCSNAFTKRSDYKVHKLKHDLQTLQKRRKEKNKLYYQKVTVAGYEKKIECEECDMKFVEMSTLKAHSALHKPFPHVCDCGIGFYVKEDLKCHMKLAHGDVNIKEPSPKKLKKNMIIIGTKKNKNPLNRCESEI